MQDKKEQAKVEVATLVEKFHTERRRNQSEADVRAGYIDQLFFALGWNIHNDPGQQTNYWREGYIRGAGFVDVGMEISGQPVLFLEAKRFGVIPETARRTGDRTPEEKQAFRYTRGRKIQYAILTNFERLQLFNADHERLIGAFDAPEEYLERFDELWRLTPEEVSGGSLGWWERDLEKKDVDLEFLKCLRAWRLTLANAIFKHNAGNPELQRNGAFDFDRLMEAVQRILDRLILIRYGDDKEALLAHDLLENTLDEYRKRGAYASKEYLMRAFVDLSHMMDEHHNTTLFAADHLCEKVVIPNEVLASVLEELSRISFRKFTSDILGNTYESYLGTKLKLVNEEIQDEERTDIRKGQGIFYTPSWVVEYIVDKTLGERLRALEQEHGLHAIEKARGLSVLDPACGSGSFLIKAYNIFADFYRRMNQGIIQEQMKLSEGFASADMFERLERLSHLPQQVLDYPQVILKEHLYGVDLDAEAAEIATVNLTMQAFADSRQKKLPKILNENIKVGNSLISGTEEELKRCFGDTWAEKRPFNWEQEFPVVMERCGFDVVIGNPPYVQSSMSGVSDETRRFLRTRYALSMGRLNTFGFFISAGLSLLKEDGLLGYILPNTFLTQEYYTGLRRLVLDKAYITSIATLDFMPFPQAVVENVIITLRKKGDANLGKDETVVVFNASDGTQRRLDAAWFRNSYNTSFSVGLTETLLAVKAKIDRQSARLGEIVEINQAIALKHDRSASIFREAHGPQYKKVLDGRDINRFSLRFPGNYLLYDRDRIHSCKREDIFLANHKILFRRVGERMIATLDAEQHYALNTLVVITPKVSDIDLRFILALLNSALLTKYYNVFLKSTKRVFSEIQARQVHQLPIRRIDFGNATDKQMHDGLVALVERMLELQRRMHPLRGTGLSEEQDLQKEIDQADRQIDELVYELYGLSEGERRAVEGG